MNTQSIAPKRPQFSPLRYPGGKSALYGFVSQTLRLNGAAGGTYVEPYAGGAGIALGLLLSEQVERIVINDLDPAIYSFWAALTEQPERFMQKLRDVSVTVDEWHRQKAVYSSADQEDTLGLGFATFFLNRTNRSGVLNAGVIGGQQQTGNYKIDARFNRETLLKRCQLIGLYANRIQVSRRDGLEVIDEHLDHPRTLTYADPPYFEKGSSLYLNAFGPQDHADLAALLNANSGASWLLTYDEHPDIEALYPDRSRYGIGVHYSVHRARKSTELLVTSDGLKLPPESVVPR